jgi:hypothetical protein
VKSFKFVVALAVVGSVATGTAAHHLYETHLSFGFSAILRATLQSTHIDERAQYIDKARFAVRTAKDLETLAKLEKLQGDLDGRAIKAACGDSDWMMVDNDRLRTVSEELKWQKRASDETACVSAKVPVLFKEADRLYDELCVTIGGPPRG